MEINDAMLTSALIRVKGLETSAIPDNSKINHIFSTDFENEMDNLILAIGKNKINAKVLKNTFTKAAVIIIALCVGAFSLIMISPQARADFKNAVMEIYENHIKFYFVSSDDTSADFSNYESITAEYIPQGFTLKEKYNEYEAVGYRYENEERLAYDIYVSLNDGLSVHTGKDQNDVEQILLLGREAYLVTGENEGKPYSTLIITGNKVTVTVYGQLDKEEIIKVGESLKEE